MSMVDPSIDYLAEKVDSIYNMDFGSRADAVTIMDNCKEISLSNTHELWDLLVHEIGKEMRKE